MMRQPYLKTIPLNSATNSNIRQSIAASDQSAQFGIAPGIPTSYSSSARL
jgi:hypothetical protein